MMKFLVLLAAVALASASLIGGKHIDIKEDGTILIKSEDGKQIHITKQLGPYGQKNIEIEVTGPNNFVKMYQFDYKNQVNTFDENQDILDAIFRENLGYVDDYTFLEILKKVNKAVFKGYFDRQMLDVLQALVDDTKWNRLVSTSNINDVRGLLNKMTQDKQDMFGVFRKLFKGVYNQQNIDHILRKIFDRQVLMTIFIKQQQMYNQGIYRQYTNEETWDMVLSFQGVFDHKILVEILNNEILRTIFVEQGLFNKVVLNQLFESFQSEGVYDPFLLEQLVNTEILKQLLVNRGISVRDILEKTFYNKDVSGYTMLEKIISEPMWMDVLVHHGIFNKDVLSLILYRYNTQGVLDPILLRHLVNKRALYSILAQYGVVDQTILRRFIENEFLGLNFLYKNNFLQQTPTMTFNNLISTYGNVPEYGNMQKYGGNFLRNMLYGYNTGPTSNTRFYQGYPLIQQVY